MAKASILIVEDKFIVAQDIAVSLKKLGYEVCSIVPSGEEAIEAAKELRPELVLMDIRLQGQMDGVEAGKQLKEELSLPIIYLTAHSDQDTLDRAIATEPYGYLLKPYDDRQLYIAVEVALNRGRAVRKNYVNTIREEKRQPASQNGAEFSQIIGSHPSMLQLMETIRLVAKTDVSVHIYGENGTGKELVADAMHRLSSRSSKPFIKLNCSAIPSSLLESALFGHAKGAFTGANKDQGGFIERAEEGTLFLDEIGDVSLDLQVKLLRVLQSRDYSRVGETTTRKADIRIVTATNRDLKELVASGKIREDFYYRINVFPLIVPPLRDRGKDILAIADHFRSIFNEVFSKKVEALSEEVKATLLNYRWPGNVRELENAMKRAFVLVQGECIEMQHLPPDMVQHNSSINEVANCFEKADGNERQAILDALRRAGGNKGKAAEILGYSRVTLWKKLTKYGITNSPIEGEDTSSYN